MTALTWAAYENGTLPPDNIYCQTRDVAQARVEAVKLELAKNGWSQSDAALITAILGELTSNAFDHNLGQWSDVPGCWLETGVDQHLFTAVIADRGQGVRSSLERVRPGIDDQEALNIAFTQRVTGRAPEKRGNGLKFVLNALNEFPTAQFDFQSGEAHLSYKGQHNPADATFHIVDGQSPVRGVVTSLRLQRL